MIKIQAFLIQNIQILNFVPCLVSFWSNVLLNSIDNSKETSFLIGNIGIQ